MPPLLLFGVWLWASGFARALCRVLAPARRSLLGANLGAIVCQPQLGASLRKGWFRMIERVADRLPPQDRILVSRLPRILWSRSYCIISCGGAPLAVLKQYIENQERPE